MNKAANVKWIWLASMKTCQSHFDWKINPLFCSSRKFHFYCLCVIIFFHTLLSVLFLILSSLSLFVSFSHLILPFFAPHLTMLLLCLWFSPSRHLICFGLFSSFRLNVLLSPYTYFYFLLYLFVSPCLLMYFLFYFFSLICYYFISLFLSLSFHLVFFSVVRPAISYPF
jgi:hypothetical protein